MPGRAPKILATRQKRPRTRTPIGHRPEAAEIAAAKLLLEPWQWLTSPRFFGEGHVPSRGPFLLVGNHTLMGVLDVPLMVLGLHERRGVLVRSLGDHLHFKVPLWRDLLTRFGTVDGTRENCEALMRAGEPILVFPGGGREVFKHKGEQYHLIWKSRIGFAALAIKHGYPIVPFAAVGAEECYDILVDSDEMRHSPIGPLLERLVPRADEIPPLVRGIGPLPRPQRFYFWFGAPIGTARYAGGQDDQIVCMRLRRRVQRAIEKGIAFLLNERKRDPQSNLPARLLGRLRSEGGRPQARPVKRQRRSVKPPGV
ncbi:MAG: acyltransferase family protein [Deltaproteobacteria bacterium]|nr:acyltransferase family protein [Deltaproteobacteria bacterium]